MWLGKRDTTRNFSFSILFSSIFRVNFRKVALLFGQWTLSLLSSLPPLHCPLKTRPPLKGSKTHPQVPGEDPNCPSEEGNRQRQQPDNGQGRIFQRGQPHLGHNMQDFTLLAASFGLCLPLNPPWPP